MSLANEAISVPVAWRLYLPTEWTEGDARRRQVGVPSGIRFRTKGAIALEEIDRLRKDGVAEAPVTVDAGYGVSAEFRQGLTERRLAYVVGTPSSTTVWSPGQAPLPRSDGRDEVVRRCGCIGAPDIGASRSCSWHGRCPLGVDFRIVEGGVQGRVGVSVRASTGPPGAPGPLVLDPVARGVVADRVAGGREGSHEILAEHGAGGRGSRGAGSSREGPMADRTGLRGTEAGVWSFPLRGARVAGVPSPRGAVHRGVCVHGDRESPIFPLNLSRSSTCLRYPEVSSGGDLPPAPGDTRRPRSPRSGWSTLVSGWRSSRA